MNNESIDVLEAQANYWEREAERHQLLSEAAYDKAYEIRVKMAKEINRQVKQYAEGERG